MSFWFVLRRSSSAAVVSALLLSLLISSVRGQQEISLRRQTKSTRTRTEPQPTSQLQKPTTKSDTTEPRREDFLEIRREQIDRLAGRTPDKKLISEIERGWQPAKTNAITQSVNQDIQPIT